VQPGLHGFVAETEEKDDRWSGKTELYGYVFWLRVGEGVEAQKWKNNDSLYSSAFFIFHSVWNLMS